MLKTSETLKQIEVDAQDAVHDALRAVSIIDGVAIDAEPHPHDRGVDFFVHLKAHRRPWTLVCEVKSSGQPRFVRNAIYHLRQFAEHHGTNSVPMLITPYLSEQARSLCREHSVNYLDFEGNCRIVFDGIYIERETGTRPQVEKRELRSLFKPKSAQVLRVLLKEPQQTWKVADLAQEAGVSLGHISNVSTALINREWALRDEGGLRLTRPGALLDDWRDSYEPPPGDRRRFYTLLHGKAFDEATRELIQRSPKDVMLAAFSAAQWLAPYGRSPVHYLYASQAAMPMLKNLLRVERSTKGENLVVTELNDDGLLRDMIEPSPGIHTTGVVQTYLDLSNAGERGREAADHLREERLSWPS